MKEIFKIKISHKTFEQSHISRNTLEKTYEDARIYNVEDIKDFRIKFIEYIEKDGQYIGVKLKCDYGHGYGFRNGYKEVELNLGEIFHFTHEGTCVDDDGCPEDFSIEYYLCLYVVE